MGSRKKDGSKNKNHAQDCGTLIEAGDQRPAILPWFLDFGWRPSLGSYGRLARCAQPPDCCWTVSRHEREHRSAVFAHHARMLAVNGSHPTRTQPRRKTFKQTLSFEITRENARRLARARTLNDECCASRAAPCNAPRPSSSHSRGASGGSRPASRDRDANGCPSRGS